MDKKKQIKIFKLDDHEVCFDLINFDFPLANAIRRILLSEVPVMAIDKIHLYCNTSELPDFALCQRIGLIPIKADPDHFDVKGDDNDQENEKTTIKLKIQVQCPPDYDKNLHVYSRDIEWVPIGNQSKVFPEGIQPVDDDILLMKLAPSQKIDAILYCKKSIGKDHAKYCPVAACYYCYLTEFRFVKDQQLSEHELEQLKIFFPIGYLNYEEIDQNGNPKIVNNRFNKRDFIFQSCPTLKDKIVFETKSNTLSFTVESIGIVDPSQLVLKSIDVLKSKCTRFLASIYQNMT